MEISPTLTGPLPNAQTGGETETGVISSDFETFLKMLTVQMQNQDPLNPIKSEDYAVQLATFSGVEQQVRTNDLLEALAAQMGVSGMAQLAGWVGMEARAVMPGYFDGAPITLTPNPESTADRADLVVSNADGFEVQRIAISVSKDPITWTGLDGNGAELPHGTYSFEVESFSNGALSRTDPAEVYSRIVEARADGGATILVMEGGAEVPANEVTAIREPEAAVTI